MEAQKLSRRENIYGKKPSSPKKQLISMPKETNHPRSFPGNKRKKRNGPGRRQWSGNRGGEAASTWTEKEEEGEGKGAGEERLDLWGGSGGDLMISERDLPAAGEEEGNPSSFPSSNSAAVASSHHRGSSLEGAARE